MNEVLRKLNEGDGEIDGCRVAPAELGALVKLIGDGTISGRIAKEVFEKMWNSGEGPRAIVEREGLRPALGRGPPFRPS